MKWFKNCTEEDKMVPIPHDNPNMPPNWITIEPGESAHLPAEIGSKPGYRLTDMGLIEPPSQPKPEPKAEPVPEKEIIGIKNTDTKRIREIKVKTAIKKK